MRSNKFFNKFLILIVSFIFIFIAVIYLAFPLKYREDIKENCDKFRVDFYLVIAVVKTESNFVPDANSNKGAIGLMQIMPPTAEYIAESILNEELGDVYQPKINIRYGVAYLKYLQDKFSDDYTSLAAYNAGEGNVVRWLKDERYSKDGKLVEIPFKETKKYVESILFYKKIYKIIYPYIT